MKKLMIMLLGAAVCCTQIVSAEVKITDNTSVDLYVQNGLIGHYDAIDNGGRGIHNTSASTWVNLAPADKEGRIDDITLHTDAITIKDNALTKKKTGLFGYINGYQPTNVATFEGTISGIADVRCSHSDYGGRPLLSLMTISKWQQVILAPNWLRYSRDKYPEVPDVRTNDYAFVFDNGGASAEHGGPNPKRFNPTLDKRLDALTISATYDHPTSGAETCVYDESYVNGGKLQRLANFSADWSYPEGNSGNTTFGGRINTSSSANENLTYNYSMHSIRLYNRKLSDEEVHKNAFVDHYRFEGAVSGVDVVSDGEGAYTVTGTFLPLDFAGNMTVKITELSAVDEAETVQEFTVKPGEGGARSFSFTGRLPRCLVTVTVSQTYDGMTLEKSISGFKTWEDAGTAGDNSWIGEWTDPVTSWYAAPEKWSAGRFPIAGDTLAIGDKANKSYAVRLGVPVSVGPFASPLNIASMVGQSNRLEIANGAELSLGNGELCVVKGVENDKMYGELILSNGTLKVGALTGGYSKSANHLGRIVVDGNSQLLVSGNAWIGAETPAATVPFGGYSHVAMLVRGGNVEVKGANAGTSSSNNGFFYGSSVPLTIEGGKITTTKLAFISTINMSGGEIAASVGLLFNNGSGDSRMNQSGGKVSGVLAVDRPGGYYTISGGEFDCETFASGVRNSGTADRSLLFRTVGSKPKVSIASYFNNGNSTHRNWFMFWDYALGADGRVSAHENAATSVFGYYHVAPLGGVQLIHTNCVTLVHNAEKDLVEDTTQRSGYGIKTLSGDMWDYGISADKRRMEATLKPDFKLTNGALLDTSVDRGYLDLSDQLAPGLKGLKSVTVKLALEPQTGTTLNDIIAKINESGAGTASAIDDGSGRWNVQVELPVTSVEKTAGERVVLDFTEYNTFKSMATPTPTVRAKIKGARVTVLRKGLVLFVL